jgi:hypothetical protein
MVRAVILQMANLMLALPTQGGFYEKTPPRTTKIPFSARETGKNTEKSIWNYHFPDGP